MNSHNTGLCRFVGLLLILLPVMLLAACTPPDPGSDAGSQLDKGAVSSVPCSTCHVPGNTSLDPLLLNGSGTAGKHVRHVTTENLACVTCHSGYASSSTHVNQSFDTGRSDISIVKFDGDNPFGSWLNPTGGKVGQCANVGCHGPTPLEWYGTTPWVLPPNCSDCHGGLVGTKRDIVGGSGDFNGNAQVVSHHVAGADPTADQCQVCHEMTAHMGGTVRLSNPDTGAPIVYSPADPSTLEPFCLGCHDADGATATAVAGGTALDPFNDGDGTVLGDPPYPFAASIAASWAKTYSHGPNGNHAPADQLTCADCHGKNGTMNAHGSNQEVLATQKLVYFDTSGTFNANNYALCFNCHSAYPGVTKENVFGVLAGGAFDAAYGPSGPRGNKPPYATAGTVTRFSDHNVTGDPFGLNDPATFGFSEMNLHWFHIEMFGANFRGTGVSSGTKCFNCHDVHGSNTPGALYDALLYSPTTVGPNTYGTIGTALGNLINPPTNCAFNCHVGLGTTRAWFDPLVE